MARLTRAHFLVLSQLARLLLPASVVVASLLVVDRHATVTIPKWFIALAAVLSIPPYHICAAWVRYWQDSRRATALGAVLPPRWDGKLPGNWDVLTLVNRGASEGYLSTWSLVSSTGLAF